MRATRWGALALAAACGGASTPAVPPAGTLTYAADGSGDPVVHRVKTDGTGDVALTVCPAAGYPGPVDPRGELVLVVCASGMAEVAHLEQLRVVPLAGGAPVDLGPPARTVRNPVWAPDGSWIVFESDVASFRDLYRVARDGSDLKRVTDEPAGNFEPTVEPSGSRLAFVSSRDGNAEVYVAGVDGSNPVRLTTDPADDMRPSWSPDGASIAFLSMRGGAQRVWRMGAGGGDPKPLLVDAREVHTDLAWAPDGSALAVTIAPSPKQSRVDIVRLDGTVEASFGAPDKVSYPAWSPDSAWLALSVDGKDGADVVLATRDGRTRKRVTTAAGADWLPRWGK